MYPALGAIKHTSHSFSARDATEDEIVQLFPGQSNSELRQHVVLKKIEEQSQFCRLTQSQWTHDVISRITSTGGPLSSSASG